MFHRKMVCEKNHEFPTTSWTENFWEDDSAILKVLHLKTVRKVCVTIKENHTGKKIAEKLDMDLVRSDHIKHTLMLTSRVSDKIGSAMRWYFYSFIIHLHM